MVQTWNILLVVFTTGQSKNITMYVQHRIDANLDLHVYMWYVSQHYNFKYYLTFRQIQSIRWQIQSIRWQIDDNYRQLNDKINIVN